MSGFKLFGKGGARKTRSFGLVLLTVLAALLFSSLSVSAPMAKPKPMVGESGSGTLEASGFGVIDAVDFVYDEVRHISLTIGYYSDENGASADLFAGPVWADGIRSKSVWVTGFPSIFQEDDFDYFETETVEFDAKHWKIEIISLGLPEKYVRYSYTVTYPKP